VVKKQYGRAWRLLQVRPAPPRHRGQPFARTLRTLRLRTLRFFPPTSRRSPPRPAAILALICIRPIMSSDPRLRIASSPYLATIDQAPIVFAPTRPSPPRSATRIGRLPGARGGGSEGRLLAGHYPARASPLRAHDEVFARPFSSREFSLTRGPSFYR
jgi:hypothetical protein